MRFLCESKRDTIIITIVVAATIMVAVFVMWSMSCDLGGSSGSSVYTKCDHMTVEEAAACPVCCHTSFSTKSCFWWFAALIAAAILALIIYGIYKLFQTIPDMPRVIRHPPPEMKKVDPLPPLPQTCPCPSDPTKRCTFSGVVSSTVAVSSKEVPIAFAAVPAPLSDAPSFRAMVGGEGVSVFSPETLPRLR
jgi:hypothetical protein